MSSPPLLYDWSGKPVSAAAAPITSRPGQALTSPQGGAVVLGSDYAATSCAQVPKIDATGNAYAVPMLGTTPVPVQVNAVTATPSNAYGSVSLAWDPTNSRFTPFQVDATGAGVTRNALATTAAYAPGASVNTTASAGKSMLSIYNASTFEYVRCLAVYFMCPAQAGVSSGLLSSSSYTTVGIGVARFTTAHTGGSVVAASVHDTRDTLDTSITCRTGATIAGQAAAFLRVFDAANNASVGYGHREDPGVKVWVCAPGEGLTFQCLSATGTGGVNFYVTAVVSQNTA